MSAIDMRKEATARSAMKLARKALMDCHYYMINAGLPNQSLLNEAFTAYMELEAALALVNEVDQEQPAPATELREQEPVAWYRDEDGIRIYYESKVWDNATPLYTSPPAQRKPLTDEEIDKLLSKFPRNSSEWSMTDFRQFARAAHNIKENT